MHNFKELKVWQRSVDFAVDIYKITQNFPQEEKYGLVSQIKRASVSIPANIAEGTGRRTDKDFNNFLGTSLGSSYELETELIISQKLNLLSDEEFKTSSKSLEEIQKMIVGLQKSLNINY